MRKVFTSLCLFSLCCFGATQVHAAGTPFEIEYNFDADTPDGHVLPEGWAQDGTRFYYAPAVDFGSTAHSGENALGATYAETSDVLYTPMIKLVGGEPCTIEFQLNTPKLSIPSMFNYGLIVKAGTAQEISAQTIEVGTLPRGDYKSAWKACSFTFTPEADGEYCFSIHPDVDNSQAKNFCQAIVFDSFKISGTAPGIEPAPGGGSDFEMVYDFDADTPEGHVLPEGWAQDGTRFYYAPAVDFGSTAHSGENVLGATYALTADIIYTPMMKLAAGKPCTIEFQLRTPALRSSALFNYSIDVTAGAAQETAAQTIAVGTVPGGDYKDWKACSFTFTPETDGDYCFALNPKPSMDSQASSYCGTIAFDSFKISGTAPGEVPPPAPEPVFTVDFEDDALFPGIRIVPLGWATTGVKPFTRKATADLLIPVDAPSGKWVMGNVGAGTQENNLLITPVYDIKAGVPAGVQFKFYAPTPNTLYGYGFKVYAAPSKDTPLAEAILVGTVEPDFDRVAEFVDSDIFTFIPEADGSVCFMITAFNEYGYNPGGPVAFDDFTFFGVAEHMDQPEPGPVGPTGPTEAFELECNFDIDSDFPDGAGLPEGWAQDGAGMERISPLDKGWTKVSGDYILSNTGTQVKFNEVIYTPVVKLVAGNPCTVEFKYIAPGGTPAFIRNVHLTVTAGSAQNAGAQTIAVGESALEAVPDWKDFSFSFTPETDGEYCFAIRLTPYNSELASQCGSVGFDDFFVSGTRYAEKPEEPVKELEPNAEYLADCIDIPYIEDFSDASHYDGQSYLPIGWHGTGSVSWVTANDPGGFKAHAGEYYLIANHNTSGERDDKAYTPFFNLTAGTEYTVTYWAYVQGNDWNDEEILYLPELAFTVGTEHDAEFHNTLDRFSERCSAWVKRSHSFTPKVSGPYCFGFMLTGPVNSGMVFIDDLTVTSPGMVARVEPNFVPRGMYEISGTTTMVFEGQGLAMSNTSKYADSYKWTVEGAEPSTSTEAEPAFVFPADGEYTVTLAATNSRGTRTTQKKVKVSHITRAVPDDWAVTLYDEGNDRFFNRGEVPTFDTDPEGDFITGYNHYYFDLAQRFDFSDTFPVKLKNIMLQVTDRRFRGMTSYYDDQRIKPFSLVIYGSKPDGTLDETNVLGRHDSTIGEVFGSSGLGSTHAELKTVALEQPVEVCGTFYVAMHFDRGMEVIPLDMTLGRSFISVAALRHAHGKSTLYVKPLDKPATSTAALGQWCPIEALDMTRKGMGAYMILWFSAHDPAGAGEITAADGFAAMFAGDNLCLSGTVEGETIALYNLAGALVARAAAEDVTSTVAVPGLPSGVYVVKCGTRTAKVVK